MKNFGQFLVEKKILSKEHLLDCFLEQLSSMPAICQLARDKNILSTDQILQALELQSKNEIGFKEACLNLGLWSNETDTAVKKELSLIRTPLGNILLKRGLISLHDLTRALDEFFSDDSHLSSIPNSSS